MKQIKVTYQNKLGELFSFFTETNDLILTKETTGTVIHYKTLGLTKRKLFDLLGKEYNTKHDYLEPSLYIEPVKEIEQEHFWLLVAIAGDYIGVIKENKNFEANISKAIKEHMAIDVLKLNDLHSDNFSYEFTANVKEYEENKEYNLNLMLIKQPVYD